LTRLAWNGYYIVIKTILVPADETPALEIALVSALELGRRFGSHLDVLHVRADSTSFLPLAGEGLTASMIEEIKSALEKAMEDRESKARAIYRRLCAETGASASWRVAIGSKPDILAAASRLCDLVVVGRPDGSADLSWRQVLHAILFEGGRPLLLLPRDPLPLFDAPAVVAWNGSTQAAHAVTAALPFLRLAKQTGILAAGAIDTYASTAGVIAYLARHNVEAVAREFEPGYAPIGQSLLEQSHQFHAHLLVMGAYGHSRLREIVLGGATRELLVRADIPIVMAR
jgi:nucleotide-binding universal stress UspA family protein